MATITDRNGEFVGTIIEPSLYRAETAHATIRGHRSGTSIDFTKTYQASGSEYATPVDYVGQLSGDGTRIVGVWSLLKWDGSFEMFRDIKAPPDVEVEASEALPVGSEPGR